MAGALDLQLRRATALAAAARIRLTEPFLRALRRLIVAASGESGRSITERDLRRLIAALTAVAQTAPGPLAPRIRVERAAAKAGGLWPAALLAMREGERRAIHPSRRLRKPSPTVVKPPRPSARVAKSGERAPSAGKPSVRVAGQAPRRATVKTAKPEGKAPARAQRGEADRKEPIAKDGKTPSRSRGAAVAARRRAGSGPASGRRAASSADPPRTAFARLEAPAQVVAAKEFELTVGLAPRPADDTVGAPLVRPEWSSGPYALAVQVVAEGCALRAGESWRQVLEVTAESPYPEVTLHLTAQKATGASGRTRVIQALFSIAGHPLGAAFRQVRVLAAASAKRPLRAPTSGVTLALPAQAVAPDLTVWISNPAGDGNLYWNFESPHRLDLPAAAIHLPIPAGGPQAFARQVMEGVNRREGSATIFNFLKGAGRRIAQKVPAKFWELLRAAATAASGPPSVLLLSEEPFVPWELAVVEPPLLDPAAPPFLSAQARVGSWVLGNGRPALPPPVVHMVRHMAVVWGVYDRPGWARLLAAEEEAAALKAHPRFPAREVNALSPAVLEYLGDAEDPPADLVHFAVHGCFDPNGHQDGLIMVDGAALDPLEIAGTDIQNRLFVFLNACQVGMGQSTLGDYAGMAQAFLAAGAVGVVAPLWSVQDTIAKDLALKFYEDLEREAQPAALLRLARRAFRAGTKKQSATTLAYRFFGHPALQLRFVAG